MPIALDTSTNGGNATGTSLTFAHTCSGTDRILHVVVATPTADNTDYVSGVTYNGVAMTRVDSFRSPGQGGLYLYELVNPATGANNVVISTSGSVPIYGASVSHTGVRQTGQPEANNGNATDPNTTLTVSVTTITDNSWLVSGAARKTGSSDTLSAGTNTTARQVNAFVAIGDSNAAQTPPGSFGQTWNLSGSSGIGVIVVAIAPQTTTSTSTSSSTSTSTSSSTSTTSTSSSTSTSTTTSTSSSSSTSTTSTSSSTSTTSTSSSTSTTTSSSTSTTSTSTTITLPFHFEVEEKQQMASFEVDHGDFIK